MSYKTKNISLVLSKSSESLDSIIAGYYDELDVNDERTETILSILSSINEFDRCIFILYCEYNSLRKVAEQTNVGYGTIHNIVKKVRETIINKLKVC